MQNSFQENSILFVCLGNICRSPIAEGVAKRVAEERGLSLNIESRGTSSFHVGEKACSNSISISSENGVDISNHRAKSLTEDDLKEFHHIIALDQKNYHDINHQRCLKLGQFGFNNEDVPDPYYFVDRDGFREVFNMIEKAVNNFFDEKF